MKIELWKVIIVIFIVLGILAIKEAIKYRAIDYRINNNQTNNEALESIVSESIISNVVITETNKYHNYSGAHHFKVDIEVYCQEYDISGNFTYNPVGITDYEWSYEEGDILQAKIIRTVDTQTGEILDAYISECRKGGIIT